MKVKQHKKFIHELEFPEATNEIGVFISSDVHWDSPKCDRELFIKHLKKSEQDERVVIINGDFFDLMGGKFDPRRSKGEIRPEYNRAQYIDSVINDAADTLSKYNVTYIISEGNHESAILRNLETDVLERLVHMINHLGGTAYRGAYSGYIILKSRMTKSYVIKYHHGAGGNAKRSKGILSADIDIAQNPDADMLIKGHDHNKWYVPYTIRTLNIRSMAIETKERVILRTGSYKKRGECEGFSIEKDFNEPTLGGWFVDFKRTRTDIDSKSYKCTIIEAK